MSWFGWSRLGASPTCGARIHENAAHILSAALRYIRKMIGRDPKHRVEILHRWSIVFVLALIPLVLSPIVLAFFGLPGPGGFVASFIGTFFIWCAYLLHYRSDPRFDPRTSRSEDDQNADGSE